MKRSVHAGWLLAVLLAGCSRVPTTATDWPPPPPPPAATITGQVIKGYVQGALVFADANGNRVADAGEVVVETDAQGRYTLPADEAGAITAIGGVDTVTNVPLTGNVFRAPPGASVVTPFTTLVTQLTDDGATAAEAEIRIRAAFGVTLPAGSTLLTFDPVGNVAGAAVEDKSEAVMNTLSAVRSMLEGAGVPDAANRAAHAMTELASAATQPLRLEETAVVGSVLQSALSATDLGAASAADVERVAAAISSVNTQLLSTSGTGEQAVNATRFAQSQLQDLMTQIGQTAAQDPGASIDLDRLDEDATATITQIVESPVDVISQNQATSIAAALRFEDQVFAFALRPAVVLVNGSAAAVQNVSVRFDLPGLELKKVTGADDSAVETLLPGADGAYLLEYAELDKVRVVPPADFNGRITLTVTLTYAGVGARPAESLHVDLAPVNDAPLAAAGFTATLRPSVAGTAGTLFGTAFSDTRDAWQQRGGSAPDLLAGIAIAANDAAPLQGTWQYSADGQTWIDLPAVSENAALTIAAATRIRFQPASGSANEQPGELTAYLLDSSAGPVVAGARVSVVAAARGGTSQYASAAVTLASGPIVNLASPALSQATGPLVNADMLAAGLPLTVSIAAAQASAGDRVELRLDGRPFEPSLTRVLTAADVERGTITFTIPASGLGADGEKSVSVMLTYATSGVLLASRPLALSLDTEAPAAPTPSLTGGSDTGVSGSDRITADASPTLRITLPLVGRAKPGDEVRLQDGATLLAAVRLDTADIAAGFVNLRAGVLVDGVHSFTARLVDVAANLSPSSDVVSVAVDTEAPAAVTLDLAAETAAAIDVNEAKDFVLTGGGAETGSTVRVEITTIPAAPLDFRATPDLSGRFAAVVDARRAGGPGSVTVTARVVDIAGNTGPVALAQLNVAPAAAGSLIEGAAQTDEIAVGMSGADTFVAGTGPRQDYFVGSAGFDTVRLRGRQADYGLAIVPAAQRDVHAELIGSAVLQPDAPLVRIAGRGASGGEILFVQAEALEFVDGRLRITPREIVCAASAAGGAAIADGRGGERLFATNGGQQLSAGGGGDVLVGGTGADTLSIYGYSAAERELVGGDGDDTLRIGGQSAISGARVLAHGGSGRDRFQILPENGVDLDIVIKDLHPGEDQIDLSALRIRQGQVLRSLTLADLGLPALSSALAMPSRSASIELAGFVGISGTPLRGTLRLELSPHGAPGLTAGDFILGGN